jgi:hypothetical protein
VMVLFYWPQTVAALSMVMPSAPSKQVPEIVQPTFCLWPVTY